MFQFISCCIWFWFICMQFEPHHMSSCITPPTNTTPDPTTMEGHLSSHIVREESSYNSSHHRYNAKSISYPKPQLTFGLGDDPRPKPQKIPKGRKSYISKSIHRNGIEVEIGIQSSIDRVLRAQGNLELVTS